MNVISFSEARRVHRREVVGRTAGVVRHHAPDAFVDFFGVQVRLSDLMRGGAVVEHG